MKGKGAKDGRACQLRIRLRSDSPEAGPGPFMCLWFTKEAFLGDVREWRKGSIMEEMMKPSKEVLQLNLKGN